MIRTICASAAARFVAATSVFMSAAWGCDAEPLPPDPPEPVGDQQAPSSSHAAPIAGGTLLALRDGRAAVASDPDRGRIYVVDVPARRVRASVRLQPADEPGRLVEDGAGRVHVALRRGGALVTLSARDGSVLARRPVCAAPRGLAFDRSADRLHVACAGGELVSIAPDPKAEVSRTVMLDRDLRDVVVDGDRLLVSRFNSAEVLVLDADGNVVERHRPPKAMSLALRMAAPRDAGAVLVPDAGASDGAPATRPPPPPAPPPPPPPPPPVNTSSPSVGWRLVANPAGGAVFLHQRGFDGEVSTDPGGYGAGVCGGGIVESVITAVRPSTGFALASPSLMNVTVAVDVAMSPDGRRVAIVAPGNAVAGGAPSSVRRPQVVTGPAESFFNVNVTTSPPGVVPSQPCINPPPDLPPPTGADPPPSGDTLPDPIEFRQPTADAVAVAFDARGNVIVQTREPASLQVLTQRALVIPLSTEKREDGGHALFHTATAGGLACASCHPEGGEDGRTWTFRGLGPRRTQSLRGGIMETAPFHWNGEMKDLSHLMREVFVGRMRGPATTEEQVLALKRWLQTVPALPQAKPRDAEAVARGRALFEGSRVGCAACHGGPQLTNNMTVDVGTGGPFQVPPLRGVAWRAPFMHNGCAQTLADRFGPCGGKDDQHGAISGLAPQEIADLVAYLESL